MNILVFGDLHCHSHRPNGPDPEYGDTRKREVINSLEWVYNLVREIRPVLVVHLGDDGHIKGKADSRSLAQRSGLYAAIAEVARLEILLGNHDPDSNGDSYVRVYQAIPNVKVVEMPELETFGDHSFLFLPYYRNRAVFLEGVACCAGWKQPAITFAHLIPQEYGGRLAQDIPAAEAAHGAKMLVCGHLHTPARLDSKDLRVVFPGALLTHNFSDDGPRGCQVISIDGSENAYNQGGRFYRNPHSKTFKTLSYGDKGTVERTSGEAWYLRLKVPRSKVAEAWEEVERLNLRHRFDIEPVDDFVVGASVGDLRVESDIYADLNEALAIQGVGDVERMVVASLFRRLCNGASNDLLSMVE